MKTSATKTSFMQTLKLTCFAMMLFLGPGGITAHAEAPQPAEKTFSYEKGQIADFLFAIQRTGPSAEATLQEYFREAIPIAMELGYQPLSSLSVPGSTQGNFLPDYLAMGAWKDMKAREQALQKIEERVSNFHQKRRDIWSVFNMAMFEVKEDTSFTVRSDKTYVVTAYWEKSPDFRRFKTQWLRKTQEAGGRVQLALEDSSSPFGYDYQPDYMTITEWESPEAFDSFYRENLAMDHRSVQHVNQFFLQLNPR